MKVARPYAGEVQRRRARSTGVTVVLFDAREPDNGFSGDYREEVRLKDETGRPIHRWVTFCDHHATYVMHPSRKLATYHMAAPEGWCRDCQELAANGGKVR